MPDSLLVLEPYGVCERHSEEGLAIAVGNFDDRLTSKIRHLVQESGGRSFRTD
jgi:hypothetical protein